MLHLNDFDFLGLIRIPNAELDPQLINFVTPTSKGFYLSRSETFWHDYSCIEAAELRKKLYNYILNTPITDKNAFVALDYISNISGKTYYKSCEGLINKNCSIEEVNKAKQCLYEDIDNMIKLIEHKDYKNTPHDLPKFDGTLPTRNIECNNMALLYIFTKSLTPPSDYTILNTGLGGVFVGPFFKSIYGTEWTNLLKSKYVKTNTLENNSILDLIVDKDIISNKKVLFLDDNVGTGLTMFETKKSMEEKGYEFKCGAVQYNWINYFRVSAGEKDIEKFDPTLIDYVTQFNYPGHKLLEHSIEILKGNLDYSSELIETDITNAEKGDNYLKYRDLKHYQERDLEKLQEKSYDRAKLAGFEIYTVNDNRIEYNNKLSKNTIELMKNISQLTKDCYHEQIVDEQQSQ